jgi:nicotinic acid phosphoribosyltransferase
LDPEVFDLPVEKIKDGYYTDAYFSYARSALLADGRHPRVLMQVFQKKEAVLGGTDEAIAILKLCSHGWRELVIHALHDRLSYKQAHPSYSCSRPTNPLALTSARRATERSRCVGTRRESPRIGL